MLVHAAHKAEALAFPDRHNDKHAQTQRQRQPTAGEQFSSVRREQRDIHKQQTDQQKPDQERFPVPVLERHRTGKNTGQHHRTGHCDTVCRCQIARMLEAGDNDNHRKVQQPVNGRDVNLARFHF
ncbi:hypothetical protein SRABI106_02490 [Rahnella aquatilis]|nr:hypothetical protein SRABI106_02490 [Rahnella aquatilis]